jgi:hypothetical protein
MIVLSALGTLSALTVVSVEGGLAMTGNDRFHAIAVYAADFNGDGWDDDQGTLVSNLATDHTPSTADGFGTNTSGGLPVFAYADVDGDGKRDLIAGTLAARTDSTTPMVLFFGTGGIESVPATSANAFFAIYADTGAIRSKVHGHVQQRDLREVLRRRRGDTAAGPVHQDGRPGDRYQRLRHRQLHDRGSRARPWNRHKFRERLQPRGKLGRDGWPVRRRRGDLLRDPRGRRRARRHAEDRDRRRRHLAGRTQGMGPGDQATGSQQVGTTSGFTLMGWRVVL